MTFLTILEGKPNTGKTTVTYKLKELLVAQGYIEKIKIPLNKWDSQFLLIKENKGIILQTGTDIIDFINKLKAFAQTQLNEYPNVDMLLIVPCRDNENPILKRLTIEACEELSTNIRTFLPSGNYFDSKIILQHLIDLGFAA